jgi:hypothetical protein
VVRFQRSTRISTSFPAGPVRFQLSEPLGRGRVWGSVGMRAGRTRLARFSALAQQAEAA